MKILLSLSSFEPLSKVEIRKLERDPQAFADTLYLSDLVAILKDSNAKYATGTSPISDKAFDILKEDLQRRKPDHAFLKQIGAPVPKVGSRKVKLPFPLFSLDKIKPDQSFDQWVKSHVGPYVVSDKEDGNSLLLVYDKGVLLNIYTRGDGTMGQDVTFLAPHLSIPQTVPVKTVFAVRAEAIMPNSAFLSLFKDKYRNPRNLVAGAMNKRSVHESIPHIHVVAYEVVSPRMKPSEALSKLKTYKFLTVPNKVVAKVDQASLTSLLADRKSKSKYDIDGLVVEQDKVTKRPAAGSNPDYAVAFKVMTNDQIHATKVIRVEWNDSQHGALKPVLIIEPVELPGNTINRVTGHNAFFIQHGYRQKDIGSGLPERPIGPGAVVKIVRSGDVIPHVVEVVKGARVAQMPDVPYKEGTSGPDVYTTETTDLTKAKQITSFFTTVGVDYMKLSTVQKLIDSGLNSVVKILRATPTDFLSIPGFKEVSANKLYQAIQAKTKEVELSKLMDASGVFGPGVGERRLAPLVKMYPDVLSWTLTPAQVELKVLQVPGFNALAKVFALGLPKFVRWLRVTKIKPTMPVHVHVTGSALKGQVVVFTGFRDQGMEEQIAKAGGEVGTTVNARTTILLVKDKNSTSSKVTKASSIGVKIMNPDEFSRKYKF